MNILLAIARLLLVVVFAAAGLAKLVDLPGSRKAVADFGVPAPAASVLGVALPLGELAVAIALVFRPTAWWGAAGAFALLLLFIGAIAYNLAQGRKPDCNCFGQLHAEPIGNATLARDGALAAVAGFILIVGHSDPGLSMIAWAGQMSVAAWVGVVVALLVLGALAVEGWLLSHVLRQNGRLLARVDALESGHASADTPATPAQEDLPISLPFGSVAPSFSLRTLDDQVVTLQMLVAASKPVVLIFIASDCGPCMALLPKIGRWQRDYADRLTIALISTGTPEAIRMKTSEHGITHVLLQQSREVALDYHVSVSPSAVLVKPDGTIGSIVLRGEDQIASLVASAVGLPAMKLLPMAPQVSADHNGNGNNSAKSDAPAQVVGPRVGEPAPSFKLPNLTGKMVDQSEFHDGKTLVLFWNPACGFCQRMLDDLKAWESAPPKRAPRLLVVSTGTVEANQEQGIHAPVLLDQGFTVAHSFGAHGTPSAVLVDAHGKIASEVGVGAPAVLALAGGRKAAALRIGGRS